METFLFQATIYLGAAVIAVPLAARFGLGSVLSVINWTLAMVQSVSVYKAWPQ